MFKYTCLNPISKEGLDLLTKDYANTDKFEEAQAVLVRSAKMHDMEPGKDLLAVARAGAGVNNIPIDKYAEHGIVVFNTPGANANGVKELVIAGMLMASRDIIGGVNWVADQAGDDEIAAKAEKQKKLYAGHEIYGKKLGIIGLGAIGVRVANAAIALGMDVYGYDPYISVEAAWNLSRDIKHIRNVDEIYENCDYITIHVPLTDDTKKKVDAEAIGKMKDGVVVLNFARDLLVNEDDMMAALENGKVKRYVTDFPNPTVVGKKGVIVIPHLGASTEEAEDNCAKMAVNQLMDFMENGNIRNSVNFPACDLGPVNDAHRLAIYHKNVKNMLGQFTSIMGAADMNIANMTNKSKGDYAYSLFDIESPLDEAVLKKLEAVEGVVKIRVIK
ncbi:MAG: phosphoglycerate dehydrogenase [Lachnospiraceae bacterium]|nr:phosphoglycerate dehydrogenase [Lachnospiraceae bacterium]